MRYVPAASERADDSGPAKVDREGGLDEGKIHRITGYEFVEENRSDQLSRDTIVCPSCGGRMVLVDITQRVRGERLTFRCELCREIVVRNSDEAKARVDDE